MKPKEKQVAGSTRRLPTRRRRPQTEYPSKVTSFPIVGIGASAGGLEAIKELLQALPVDTGMAFILIQHLDPTHESMGPEILSRATPMPVHEVKNGARVEPNQVYVIPPNFAMKLIHGVLSLLPLRTGPRGQSLVVDLFFQSLALDQKRKAIGVILSGAGSDGTLGLKAIKSEGGLAIAQDPKSAKYSGMPESAIKSGFVDLILPPKRIAQELARISKHPNIAARESMNTDTGLDDAGENKEGIEAEPIAALRVIFGLLRAHTQVDFSNYKHSTVMRRIQRRMIVRKSENIDAYAKYLKDNPKEVRALFSDLLIHVTEFFRDPDFFKALEDNVFTQLLKDRKAGQPIRIWVPGCSTGEEAYSIAISLLEFLDRAGAKIPIQIFATCIGEQVIQIARAAFYSKDIESAVSKERLIHFFEKVEGGYKITKAVRDLCLFSKHDVTSDPPFSKLDLVSCRNVLIYFSTVLQKRVMPIFHYALNPGGFLFLGKSESIGGLSNLFNVVDKDHRIFSKADIPTPIILRAPLSYEPDARVKPQRAPEQSMSGSGFQRDTERVALSRYAPPSVTVNADMEILQYLGRTAPCLEPGPGLASNNLFKMARQELVQGLRTTVQLAAKKNASASLEGLSFQVDGKRRTFNIEAMPTNPSAPLRQRNYVIFFEEVPSPPILKQAKGSKAGKKGKGFRDEESQQNAQLEKELSAAKESHSSMTEEFEAAQEELTSANEELQSTNEELQSLNEELETSKEELQSSNEELTTVNDELQTRNADLIVLSSDLNNVMNNVEIPIVLVGSDGRIRRFSPQAENVFNLIPGDIGRPITDFKLAFEVDLAAMISKAIKILSAQEFEVHVDNSRWIRVQVRPYRTVDDRINGAVIALVDITSLKDRLSESEAALKYASSVADTLALPLVVLDENLHFLSANQGFIKMFELVPHKDIGTDLMRVLGGKGWSILPLRKLLIEVIAEDRALIDFEIEHDFPDLGHRIMLLNARQIKWQGIMQKALLLSIDNITERKMLERSLERASQVKDEFLAILSHELRTPLTTILGWAQELRSAKTDPRIVENGLSIIEQSALVQGQLIDDLLDVSRIQAGKLSIDVRVIDLVKALDISVNSVRNLAEKKSILIEKDFTPSACMILADATRVQQIFWNLLTNAIKFTPRNGKIFVKLDIVESPNERLVQVRVCDSGIGIKSEFIPHIFERFSQEDSSMTRLYGGLGLGLGLVKSLVEMQDGSVAAESPGEGKGATFTVSLPLVPTDNIPILIVPKTIEPENPVRLDGIRVLVVDDDTSNRELFDMMLKSGGAEVRLAQSAAEARQISADFKPDILISDISMPTEDGYSLIRKIRQLDAEHGGKIPAIALTAYAAADDIRRVIDAGFSAHVAKPVEKATLFQTIANLVIKPGVRRE
jgi:two-component system CheB/CheR fusion protein